MNPKLETNDAGFLKSSEKIMNELNKNDLFSSLPVEKCQKVCPNLPMRSRCPGYRPDTRNCMQTMSVRMYMWWTWASFRSFIPAKSKEESG